MMLGVAPGLTIVDLTHDVPGFAVKAGAEILEHATRYMPTDSVYLAIVDPGVGTKRQALALRTDRDALLVGPDNGLLVRAAESLGGIAETVVLDNPDYHVHPVSNTFHGRDVFAPAAAHLAAGTALAQLGKSVAPASLVRLEGSEDSGNSGETLEAGIISIDRFGNARLSLAYEDSGLKYGDWLRIDAGDGQMSVKYVETFGSSKAGELVLVPDSHWRLSLSINMGNASQALALKLGDRVRLLRTGGPDAAGA